MSLKYRIISSRVISSLLAISLSFGLFGCENIKLPQSLEDFSVSGIKNVGFDVSRGNLAEVAPPQSLAELDQLLESSQPQVSIISPRPQTTLQNVNVVVDLELKGYSLFKNQDLQLGPHLSLILDNEPYGDVYDLAKPIVLENLKPGTHNLSVLVEKPWSESFKNAGAFAQTTFNILTETEDDLDLPLLIYNQPDGVYQVEPILLDFYVAGMKPNSWQVRATVNDEKFLLEQMQPIYLQGFQEGNNLIQLELLDRQGNAIQSKANQAIRLITYEPSTSSRLSPLAKLVSGQISFEESALIVDQSYRDISETSLEEEILGDASEDVNEKLSTEEIESKTVSDPAKSIRESESVAVDNNLDLESENLNSQKPIVDEEVSNAEDPETEKQSMNQKESGKQDQGLSLSPEEEPAVVNENESVEGVEPKTAETTKQDKISELKSQNSEVNDSSLETASAEIESKLSANDNFQQARVALDSVPTNSVSEKIRVLTETHPEPLAEIEPLPTEMQTSPVIKTLDRKAESERIPQEKPSSVQPIDDFSSSLGRSELGKPEKTAIANKTSSEQNLPAVNQPQEIPVDSSLSQLDIASSEVRLDATNEKAEELNQPKFDIEKIRSKINSSLAIWLPKISSAWQQFSQQVTNLINKSVTALRANFSAS